MQDVGKVTKRSNCSYGFKVRDPEYKRKCNQCGKQLPLTRYFNHIECIEDILDDSLYLDEVHSYVKPTTHRTTNIRKVPNGR